MPIERDIIAKMTPEQRRVWRAIDFDVWATTREIAGRAGMRSIMTTSILRAFKRRGLVVARVSDAHGATEWAMKESHEWPDQP